MKNPILEIFRHLLIPVDDLFTWTAIWMMPRGLSNEFPSMSKAARDKEKEPQTHDDDDTGDISFVGDSGRDSLKPILIPWPNTASRFRFGLFWIRELPSTRTWGIMEIEDPTPVLQLSFKRNNMDETWSGFQ